jgi:endonuclease-3
LLLSSQTRDQVNFAAMTRLKEYGLTPQKMIEIDEDALKALLKPVSFHNNKAKFIKQVSRILLDQYNGDIPITVEEMMKLPGKLIRHLL